MLKAQKKMKEEEISEKEYELISNEYQLTRRYSGLREVWWPVATWRALRALWVAVWRAVLAETTSVTTGLLSLRAASSLCSIGRDHSCYN